MKITKVYRDGRVFYAATISGMYVERSSLAVLKDALAVRKNFANIFSKPLARSV